MPTRLPLGAAMVLLLGTVPHLATAQVTPDRTYYGRFRPVPMTVRVPAELKGEASIALLEPVSARVRSTAVVAAGSINLAAVFPDLWREPSPDKKPEEASEPPRLVYAQLMVGDKKVGPAVILQPLIDAPYCPLIEDTGEPKYRPSKGVYAGLRAYTDRHIVMETSLGDIQIAMRPDEAPNTVYHFLSLCAGGFYSDILFHRIKPRHPNGSPFVVQAGDPLQLRNATEPKPGAGEGGPGFSINLEPSKLPHDFGVFSMARNNLPNSAGSQFFICLSRKGTEYLDGKYTSFAQAVTGDEVILRIAASELIIGTERPQDPPIIKRCRLIDAPPYGDGPKPVTRPEDPPLER